MINEDQATPKGKSFVLHWVQCTEYANTQLKNTILWNDGGMTFIVLELWK